jgi:hypothetical protein
MAKTREIISKSLEIDPLSGLPSMEKAAQSIQKTPPHSNKKPFCFKTLHFSIKKRMVIKFRVILFLYRFNPV